jgi:hypothetical protein
VLFAPRGREKVFPFLKFIVNTALPPNGGKKRGRGFHLCLSDLYLNYSLPPYGLLNLKNICKFVEMMFV